MKAYFDTANPSIRVFEMDTEPDIIRLPTCSSVVFTHFFVAASISSLIPAFQIPSM